MWYPWRPQFSGCSISQLALWWLSTMVVATKSPSSSPAISCSQYCRIRGNSQVVHILSNPRQLLPPLQFRCHHQEYPNSLSCCCHRSIQIYFIIFKRLNNLTWFIWFNINSGREVYNLLSTIPSLFSKDEGIFVGENLFFRLPNLVCPTIFNCSNKWIFNWSVFLMIKIKMIFKTAWNFTWFVIPISRP